MQIKEAIILAGGLGTRLRDVLPDLPKCMAPVAGRPFLSYVIDELRMQGVERLIFSLGYKAEAIEKYLVEHYPTLNYTSVIEPQPLGTGGAIQLACRQATGHHVAVANGDTLFKINLRRLGEFHLKHKAECTLALKPMKDMNRYGVVELDDNDRILTFREKQFYREGLINGGFYLLDKELFLQRALPEKFSFEKDYLEKFTSTGVFYGCVETGYFIDIGIPEDYQQASIDLQRNKKLLLSEVDKNWTLFLDRDGVVNVETTGEYVLNWDQFIFSQGALDALKIITEKFGRILVVSNQRAVGKKLMSEEVLETMHSKMVKEIESAGGRIDKIYFCPDVDSKHYYRKPNPGMAFKAVTDFKDIELTRSIMVGNKLSDMRFGRSAGMFTVFIASTDPGVPASHPEIDLRFNSLKEFAEALNK